MQKIKTKLGNQIALIVFFVLTVCLYGPYSIYLPNAEELWFKLSMVNRVVLPISALLFVFLLLLSIILPDGKRHILTKLFFGLTLALYIQGNYINISYGRGVQDGSEIVWSEYTTYAIIDTFVWIVCFAVPFIIDILVKKNSKRFFQVITIASLVLTAMQIPAFVSQILTYRPSVNTEINITTDNMFELSDSNNILVFVLDTMDEAYYEAFIEAHPEYVERLTGFVHYNNAAAAGSRTIVGLPAMFTGTPFTRQDTYSDYLKKIWSAPNAFSVLNSGGYEVDVYSETTLFSEDAIDYIANFEYGGGKPVSMSLLAEKIYKMDLYKFAPHLLKQYFWYTTAELEEAKEIGNSYVASDPGFYSSFSESGFKAVPSKAKVLQVYHLSGAHSPYNMNENGEKAKSTLEQQVAGSFNCVAKMLDDLKEKGLYDDATILITADHGDLGTTGPLSTMHLVFLLKEADCKDAYRTSSAPVSGFDLPSYLASFVGKELPNPYSADLLSLEEDTQRERHFFYNTSGNSRLLIKEYISNGNVRDKWTLLETYDDSWSSTIPVAIGEELSFAAEATGNRYTVEGFGNNTGFRTKMFGPHVKLVIPLAEIPKNGGLKAYFGIYHALPAGVKTMEVSANGVTTYKGEISKSLVSDGLVVPIPDDSFDKDKLLTLEFYFPELEESEMDLKVTSRTQTLSLLSLRIDT